MCGYLVQHTQESLCMFTWHVQQSINAMEHVAFDDMAAALLVYATCHALPTQSLLLTLPSCSRCFVYLVWNVLQQVAFERRACVPGDHPESPKTY